MTNTAAAAHGLWSLRLGNRTEVISAPDEDHAWRLVRFFQDLGDLPVDSAAALRPASRSLTRRIEDAARRAGVDGGFLACLGGGMFITQVCGDTP